MTHIKILITMLTVALGACSGGESPDPGPDGGTIVDDSGPESGDASMPVAYSCHVYRTCNGRPASTVGEGYRGDDPDGHEKILIQDCKLNRITWCASDIYTCDATCEVTP